MDNSKNAPIVILGAGFGGLRAAMLLAKSGKEIILIDKNDYHTYAPILYEIAVTSSELANHCDLKAITCFPIEKLIRNLPITFINEEVRRLDVINGDIHLETKNIHFDCLILALGAETNYYNIPGLRENSLSFKSFIDALKLRDLLMSWPSEKSGFGSRLFGAKPRVVIGGGGSTGVELAGEIQFHRLADVFLVQSPPRILPNFHKKIISAATKKLEDLGVKIIFDNIVRADDKKVFLKNSGEINFDILIWTGGVKANKLINDLPLKQDAGGKIHVAKEMLCLSIDQNLQLDKKIYAIGDIACFYNPATGETVPGLASVALDQAETVVANILGKRMTYKPRSFPYILPLGGKYAIFQINGVVIEGWMAWLLKGLVELFYLLKIMPWLEAFRVWFKGMKIFFKNEKLG